MNSLPQRRSCSAGFTLVELLTVIAIIAILMALLFTGITIARNQARRARAKNDSTMITGAARAYCTEYGKYPLGSNVPSSATPAENISSLLTPITTTN